VCCTTPSHVALWALRDVELYVSSSGRAMSALGQKRTFAVQKGMSALPPKATSNATKWNVRFASESGHASTKYQCVFL
ncbi:MAG TPA: hypothetical protein VKG24_16005, partial [Pseudolabrys sp.]|nr:hypothetical protein [Pseudolabrys sp.]